MAVKHYWMAENVQQVLCSNLYDKDGIVDESYSFDVDAVELEGVVALDERVVIVAEVADDDTFVLAGVLDFDTALGDDDIAVLTDDVANDGTVVLVDIVDDYKHVVDKGIAVFVDVAIVESFLVEYISFLVDALHVDKADDESVGDGSFADH